MTPQFPNLATIVTNLYYPQLSVGRGLTAGLTTEELDLVDLRLGEARRAAGWRARNARTATDWWPRRSSASTWSSSWCATPGGACTATAPSAPSPSRTAWGLAGDLRALTDRYRALWLDRNRPGGLVDSVAWLDNLRSAYETGRPDPTWGGLSVSTP